MPNRNRLKSLLDFRTLRSSGRIVLLGNGYGFGYDAWLPSTEKVSPSRSSQLSFALTKRFPEQGVEVGLEIYGRRMRKLIDYPDGTNFTGLLAASWDDIVIKNGAGRAKGIEFMVSKTAGKFNGSISYTLSKSERKFNGINGGSWYPMKYDRRHNISAAGTYTFNDKWKLNAAFIFQTGHATTLPEAALLTEGSADPRFIYNARNNGRMPNFHRLDLGASRSLASARKCKTELRFGLYNAYNRSNPLYLDFKIERRDSDFTPVATSVKQVSFFPILPYVSYSIKF